MHSLKLGVIVAMAGLIGVTDATAQPVPLLEYTFDDQANPTSNTGSLGATFDGYLQGNVGFVPFGSGAAASFDGDVANNSVVLPGGSSSVFNIGDSDFSIVARFTTSFFDDGASRVRALAWKQATGPGASYAIGVRQENGLAQFGIADGVNVVSLFSSVPVNDGVAHEIIGTRCGGEIRLYVDGVLDAAVAIPSYFGSTHNGQPLVIGGRTLGNTDDWVGLIDYISIYDVCINPDSDGDGLSDVDELAIGTDPHNPDTDGDDLFDGTEVDMATGSGCPNPLNADSDGDMLPDGFEVSLGTMPCNTDSDADLVPDQIDPDPTVPSGAQGVLEQILRAMAASVEGLGLDLFDARIDNARMGHRNATANKLRAAANAVAEGDLPGAIDALESLLQKLDGEQSPPDWMLEGPEKAALRYDIGLVIAVILQL